jgi:hypothetical protein
MLLCNFEIDLMRAVGLARSYVIVMELQLERPV